MNPEGGGEKGLLRALCYSFTQRVQDTSAGERGNKRVRKAISPGFLEPKRGNLEMDGPMGRAVAKGNEIATCTAGTRERMTDAWMLIRGTLVEVGEPVSSVQSGRSF